LAKIHTQINPGITIVKDKVVLVTGGSKGIGLGIASAFTHAGAQVFVCGRNPPEPGTLPSAVEFITADVRDPEDGARLIDSVTTHAGKLDVLINNAGGGPPADAATASPRFTESIIRLNLLAPLNMSQLAYKALKKANGSIINIASVTAIRSSPGTMAYGAAKAGLLNATISLAQEWGPNIRVNAIIAGLIKTEAADAHYGGPEGMARLEARLPSGRMGTPEDIAKACLYLASDDAAYVSGAALEVFGGGEPPSFLSFIEEAQR
jgi:NAD(P)-dependent dehydrogenase (short-subunit alcohol dehydrogenase family)